MGQTSYSNGQLALLVSDYIARAKAKDTSLATGSPDFLNAMQIALPKYASDYAGSYYDVAIQSGGPTALPTAEIVETPGSLYEISYPSDCMDEGFLAFQLYYGVSQLSVVGQTHIHLVQDEGSWDMATSNTTEIYLRTVGRKIRVYIPASYLTVATPKYGISYKRYPTYPAVVGDFLDVPAEDQGTFFQQWFELIESI
jgi:hypothetical protein